MKRPNPDMLESYTQSASHGGISELVIALVSQRTALLRKLGWHEHGPGAWHHDVFGGLHDTDDAIEIAVRES